MCFSYIWNRHALYRGQNRVRTSDMSLEYFFQEKMNQLNEELKKNAHQTGRQPLYFEMNAFELSDLLPYTACEKIFYFSSKDRDFSFLGLGVARTFTKSEVSSFFHQYPELFLSAQFKFEDNTDEETYTLHEWSFLKKNGTCTLTIFKNHETKMYSSSQMIIDKTTPCDDRDFIPPWSSYEEFPEHDQWATMISKADALFNSGELQKIVLSRRKIFGYQNVIDPQLFFSQVLQKNTSSRSFKIFHQIHFGEAFISITPEKLFSLNDRSFETISLAGSAPRGKTEEQDKELEKFLRSDEKLIREHSLVTEELKEKLSPLSVEIDVSPLVTMKLPYIQHRQADIKAILKTAANAPDLIALLHPTPAIGGLPWDKARTRLLEIEPFQRGYYAAPVGVVSAHFSEMAVGIRSALIEADKITLFGGAGIVKGSHAEEEWNETGTKMNPFLKVVNNE